MSRLLVAALAAFSIAAAPALATTLEVGPGTTHRTAAAHKDAAAKGKDGKKGKKGKKGKRGKKGKKGKAHTKRHAAAGGSGQRQYVCSLARTPHSAEQISLPTAGE